MPKTFRLLYKGLVCQISHIEAHYRHLFQLSSLFRRSKNVNNTVQSIVCTSRKSSGFSWTPKTKISTCMLNSPKGPPSIFFSIVRLFEIIIFVLKLGFFSSPARYFQTFEVISEILRFNKESRRCSKKLSYIRSFDTISEVYCVSLRRSGGSKILRFIRFL